MKLRGIILVSFSKINSTLLRFDRQFLFLIIYVGIYGSSTLEHGNNSWPTPDLFYLPENTTVTKSFDWAEVRCVAGFFPHISMVQGRHGGVNYKRLHIHLSEKFRRIAPSIKEALGLKGSSSQFVVAHWRRGDALHEKGMCLSFVTINCRSTEEFIEQILKDTANHGGKLIYIATNERNSTELQKLKAHGFYIFSDIESTVLNLLPDSPLAITQFIIDIVLMCDPSASFLPYGITLVKRLVESCRIPI